MGRNYRIVNYLASAFGRVNQRIVLFGQNRQFDGLKVEHSSIHSQKVTLDPRV